MSKTAEVLVNTLNLDKNAWLKYRRNGLGGSDIGAICGVNPWRSAISVYLDKIGEGEEVEENEKMYWGTQLEDMVAREFAKRTGKKVKRRNAMLFNVKYPFMLANVDREVVGENAILECKTCSERMAYEWEQESIPDSYILQVQHYMYVGGYSKCYIAVLIGGQKFVWKEVPRDEDLIEDMIKIELDFWECVTNRTPPQVDGSESATEVMKYLYPEAVEGETKELGEDYKKLLDTRDGYLEDIAKLKKEQKCLEEKVDEVENLIRNEMQTAEVAKVEGYTVSWKNSNGKTSFDSKALEKELPEIYKKYAKQGASYRTLRIAKKKEVK